MMPRERVLIVFLVILCGLLVATAVHPYDRITWLMEVAPVLIVLPILALTCRRFPLTPLLYFLIFLHAIILITGGAYTYARVPLGFWIERLFSFSRNDYDRIGHFFQGLVPALAAREVLLRAGYVSSRRMALFLSICVAMAVSAWYELLEWAAAVSLGAKADDFLGTQGDPWDTQWDMFMCFIGAVAAMAGLTREQDRQIERLQGSASGEIVNREEA
jgi:putative membrane protein